MTTLPLSFLARVDRVFSDPHDRWFGALNGAVSIVTALSILAVILETVPALALRWGDVLLGIEYGSVAVFSLEYLGRLLSAPRPARYLFSFFGVVDLLAILPSYLLLANVWGFGFARLLRLLRVLRFAKIVRYRQTMLRETMSKHGAGGTPHRRLHLLNLEIYFLALGSAILILASAYYIAEGHQEAFGTMPLSILWIVETIFGGSISRSLPETIAGEVISTATRFVGAVLFGFLIAVVGGFVAKVLFGTERLDQLDQ